MHADVIDTQLVRIRKDLTLQGLTYEQLQVDILDHICCMIEEEMENGNDFESSYGGVLSKIEERRLVELQHETLILLDNKFQKMKKITYAVGLAGSLMTIAGALFKMMHWPGASIIMMLGFMSVVLVFLPLYFILSYREQVDKPKPIYPIVAYLSILTVFAGAVFKIMHWPGAAIMLRTSVIVLLVGFLPLYIVQIFKRTTGKRVNLAYIIMLLVGISIVLILSKVNISKDTVDLYTDLSIEQTESIEILEKGIQQTLNNNETAVLPEEVQKIMEYSDELQTLADQMVTGLLNTVDQVGIPISEVSRRDFRNGNRDAFIDNGLGLEFLSLSNEYKNYLLKVISDPILVSQIRIDFMFTSGNWMTGWDPEDIAHEPLIANYYRITGLKRTVVYAEYLAIEYFLK